MTKLLTKATMVLFRCSLMKPRDAECPAFDGRSRLQTALQAGDTDHRGTNSTFGRLDTTLAADQVRVMKRLARRRTRALSLMMAELLTASWETVARRTTMIAQGTCTPKEYQRMMLEKAAALQQSAIAVMTGRGKKAALAPWHKRATANARRLRRKS